MNLAPPYTYNCARNKQELDWHNFNFCPYNHTRAKRAACLDGFTDKDAQQTPDYEKETYVNNGSQRTIAAFCSSFGKVLTALTVIIGGSNQSVLAKNYSSSALIAQNQITAPESATTIDSLAPTEKNLAKLIPLITIAKPAAITVEGDAMKRYIVSVSNYQAFSENLFQPATYLKPLAEHLNSSRAWVYIKDQEGNPLQTFGTINNREQLKNLWFAIEKNSSAPKQIHVDIWDRQTDTHYKSAAATIPTD